MKEPGPFGESLPEGVELTLAELQQMACRQQHQIESQSQLLVAKEQRLRFLKQQEARTHQVAAENERLRRLRDRVEAQELKLRKLRALRGQVDQNKLNNASLTSDLDSIRALFNEKEKELSLAVAKVEELTRQLEELKRGRGRDPQSPSPAALELDKLRRELMYRNKLNQQQNARLCQQREALTQRQEEMTSIDKRISELQDRLHRKRMLNQQLANQINKASASGQQLRSVIQQNQGNVGKTKPRSGNIAAVEPYHHVPLTTTNNPGNFQNPSQTISDIEKPSLRLKPSQNHKTQILQDHKSSTQDDFHTKLPGTVNSGTNALSKNKEKEDSYLPEFAGSKSDPKYQTLPYNTKFTVNFVSLAGNKRETVDNDSNETAKNNINNINNINNNNNINNPSQQQLMTVHSIPLSGANKGLATALLNQPQDHSANKTSAQMLGPRPFGPSHPTLHPGVTRGQPVGGTSSTSSTSSSSSSASLANSHQKPVSSVAPNAVQHQKPSPIYQTSSTKIHPVQPQTLSSMPQGILLSPPQSSSTPLGTPEMGQTKPALPPKPALPVKPTPPPRQTQHVSGDGNIALNDARGSQQVSSLTDTDESPAPPCPPPPPPTSEPPLDENGQKRLGTNDVLPIIKARPLTIKKQPASEHPKLKTVSANTTTTNNNNNNNNNGVHVSINRRIEMPPAFLFPETEAPPADLVPVAVEPSSSGIDEMDRVESSTNSDLDDVTAIVEDNNRLQGRVGEEKTDIVLNSINTNQDQQHSGDSSSHIVRRARKGNLKASGKVGKVSGPRRVSFDPLALLLDASLEGELELVRKTAGQVSNASAANDEGITALHNAICAGHLDIVKFLVEFGCDVNAQDSDGWTPLHCAASCNNLAMVRFLVEHGACIFATTLSDHETAAEKCEEDEEGFDGCSEYLYSVQEKLGILNNGVVYAVYDYEAHNTDELSFKEGDKMVVLRKGDEWEREWWWSRLSHQEGYVPRNLLALYPRVQPSAKLE